MDFSKMHCFVSAAKNLNFSRTAEELYLSQPTVTAKINALEHEIGAQLFIRDKHSVKLTPIGHYLFGEFAYLLNYYKNVQKNVSHMIKANNSVLHIGYHGPYGWASIFDIIKVFRAQYPQVQFEIQVDGWGILKNAVLNRTLDIVFLETAEVGNSPQLESLSLGRGLSAVALSKDHPLAGRESVTVAELKDEPVIMANTTQAPLSIAAIHRRMTRSGLDMSKAVYVDHFENALAMTASGQGNTFLPRTFKVQNDPGLSYVDVDSDAMYLDYSLVWLKENSNKSVALFCDFMKIHHWKID